MLTLYYKPTCVFSQHVLAEAEDMNLTMRLKDISTDAVLLTELHELGGKDQTPFLVDPEQGVSMYDSNDIIDYLHTNYRDQATKQSFGGLRIHSSDEACESCQ